MARILVAYVTRKGSTAEIAQAIGTELQAAGHTADVAEMNRVGSLAGYQGVVIGGPMYMGRMPGEIKKFVGRHFTELKKVPVAAFIVCIAPVSQDPSGISWAQKALHAALLSLQPVAEAVFAGRLDPARLSWFQNWITKKAKTPIGDFRDWSAIAAWAKELPARMGM